MAIFDEKIPLLLFVLVLPWHICFCELEDIKFMSRQSYRRSLQRRRSRDEHKKRGLGLWTMPNAVSALHDHAPSVEWYYSWTPDSLGTGTGKEFIPMVWDQRDMSSVVGKRVPLLMTFNEPDNASQANMSVSDALSHWPALQGVADRLGSPACAGDVLGAGTWMDEFMTGCVSNGYRVDFMCVHAYQPAALSAQDATAALELYLKKVHVKYNKPIWLTEYSMVSWGAAIPGGKYEATFPSTATQVEFASSSAAMLDSLPFVERYAWFSGFKYLVDNASENSFVFLDSGLELTSTGVAYAG